MRKLGGCPGTEAGRAESPDLAGPDRHGPSPRLVSTVPSAPDAPAARRARRSPGMPAEREGPVTGRTGTLHPAQAGGRPRPPYLKTQKLCWGDGSRLTTPHKLRPEARLHKPAR